MLLDIFLNEKKLIIFFFFYNKQKRKTTVVLMYNIFCEYIKGNTNLDGKCKEEFIFEFNFECKVPCILTKELADGCVKILIKNIIARQNLNKIKIFIHWGNRSEFPDCYLREPQDKLLICVEPANLICSLDQFVETFDNPLLANIWDDNFDNPQLTNIFDDNFDNPQLANIFDDCDDEL